MRAEGSSPVGDGAGRGGRRAGFYPCPSCGIDVADGTPSCPYCGVSLTTPTRGRRRRPTALVAVIAAVAIAASGVLTYLGRANDDADGPVAGTDEPARPAAVPPEVTWLFEPTVGDCLDLSGTGLLLPRSCDEPHDGEVVGAERWEPGSGSLEDFGLRVCARSIEDYVGTDPWHAGLDFKSSTPTDAGWSAGDRFAKCIAVHPLGSKLEESVRGSGGIVLEGYVANGPQAIGQCFDEPAAEGPIPAIPCEEAHEFEVFAVLEHGDAGQRRYPGDDAFARVAASCLESAFAEYVGLPYESSSLLVAWELPTAESWALGNRAVACLLFASPGELSAPMRSTGGLTALAGGSTLAADGLPGIVLQPYEPPPGTAHDYSMALDRNDLAAIEGVPPGEVAAESAYWVGFSTPTLDLESQPEVIPADAVQYLVSARVFPTPKEAMLALAGEVRSVVDEAESLRELPGELGDESWAARYMATSDAIAGPLRASVACEVRVGNVHISVAAHGPGTDAEAVIEVAGAMALRAAGAAPPPRLQTDVDPEHARLIEELFDGATAAWSESGEAGVQHRVDHQYPGLGYTLDDCAVPIEATPEGFFWSAAVDPATIAPAGGWTIPTGRLAGEPLDGELYEFEATFHVHESLTGGVQYPPQLVTQHAAIIGGAAYYFPACG